MVNLTTIVVNVVKGSTAYGTTLVILRIQVFPRVGVVVHDNLTFVTTLTTLFDTLTNKFRKSTAC